MKLNFRKIMSVAASAIMLGSTFGIATAATYPAPFVESGTAAGAVIVGANAATTDWQAAIDLSQSLNDLVTTGTTTTSASITGEAAALFSSTKIYINDSLNVVKSALTDTDLKTILKDGSFSGNVDASYTQTITLGRYPQVRYDKMPSSSADPTFGLITSSSTGRDTYNATILLNKAVDFANSESEGEDITMFGKKFTVAAATDADTLVLLKEAEKLSLSSDTNPAQEVTVAGVKYTVELVSASDTAATIKVTDSAGASDQKEITEAASKKVQGLTVAVQTADETNLKLSASVIAGAEKITLEAGKTGNDVTYGEDDNVMEGVRVIFNVNGTADTNISTLTFQVRAPNSDKDSIKPGEVFVDPLFGTLKVDFAGINVPEYEADGTTMNVGREKIEVRDGGDDKIEVVFKNHAGIEKTIQFAYNNTDGNTFMQYDTNGKNITVFEKQKTYKNEYVVVGNENEGYLLKVTAIQNQSNAYSNDKVKLQDIFSENSYESSLTAEGIGSINVGGKVYDITYSGASDATEDTRYITINYPDSGGTATAIVYPTIETSKGAHLFFYKPLEINFSRWDSTDARNLTSMKFPDGDGYTAQAVRMDNSLVKMHTNVSIDDGITNVSADGNDNVASVTGDTFAIGPLTYNLTYGAIGPQTGKASNILYLTKPEGGNIRDPAIVFFEEKDDNSQYQAVIITIEEGNTGDDGIGVNDVSRTWGADGDIKDLNGDQWSSDSISLYSDSKKSKEADLWGTIALVDGSDSDQKTATVTYPDEQVYAQIYVAENAAEITATKATSGAGGKVLVVKDSESSSVKDTNLVVVGGSCINTVAAKILGSDTPLCGEAFSEKTKVGAGQYLIKSVASPLNAEKIALLVAGYNAEDTTTAAKTAKAGVATDKDKEQVYPIVTA